MGQEPSFPLRTFNLSIGPTIVARPRVRLGLLLCTFPTQILLFSFIIFSSTRLIIILPGLGLIWLAPS